MKLTWRTGALTVCVLGVVAAAGLLSAHVFTTSSTPASTLTPETRPYPASSAKMMRSRFVSTARSDCTDDRLDAFEGVGGA